MKNFNAKRFQNNLLFVSIVFAVIGNILFVVETFYPIGDWVKINFGGFGMLLGALLAWNTILVDSAAISIIIMDFLANENKKKRLR